MTPVDSGALYPSFTTTTQRRQENARLVTCDGPNSRAPLAPAIEPLNQRFRPFARSRLTASQIDSTISSQNEEGVLSMKIRMATTMAFLCVVALAQERP